MLHNTQHLSREMFRTAYLPDYAKNEIIPSMDRDLIKNNIRAIREERGLTQAEFGKPLNASRMDVSRYEKGQHLTVRLLLDIRRVYGVSLDRILLKSSANSDEGTINKADKDLMLESTKAILSAAQIMGLKLTLAEEMAYTVMLYNHTIEYKCKPDAGLAAAILKQEVA